MQARANPKLGWLLRPQRRRWRRWLLLTLTAGVVLITTWSVFVVINARQRTPAVLARIGLQPMPLTLDSLPVGYLDLLVKVQDPTFYQHHGVNLLARPGRLTTVTQALVKYLYFDHFEQGPVNKLKQTLIAVFALDALTSKEQQLKLFVNTVYLGNLHGWPVRGFEDGALIYFGRNFAALSQNEYLSLLAMLDAPDALNVIKHPQANARRVAQIRESLGVEPPLP